MAITQILSTWFNAQQKLNKSRTISFNVIFLTNHCFGFNNILLQQHYMRHLLFSFRLVYAPVYNLIDRSYNLKLSSLISFSYAFSYSFFFFVILFINYFLFNAQRNVYEFNNIVP